MELLLTVATWVGLAVLAVVVLFVLAMAASFLAFTFGSERENEGFNFYKGDLDDD